MVKIFKMLVLCVFLFPLILLANETKNQAPKPTNMELYVVHHMGQVIDVMRSETADAVWPLFRLQEPALITFQSGHILAFHLDSDDPAWSKLSVNGQTALYSATDKWGALQSPLNQAFPIEKHEAYVFAFEAFANDPFLPFLVFIHERFHQHQLAHFTEDADSVIHAGYEDQLNTDNLALMKMEEAILADFLEALKMKKDKSVRIALLNRFIAINTVRSRLLSSQSLKWELLQQQMEGLADYVSIKLLDTYPIIAKFDPIDHLQHLIKNYLQDPRIVESAVQWRHYGVGAVMGYALDDLEVLDWKEAVEQHGKGLSVMLAERLRLSEVEIQQLTHAVKQEYSYINIRSELENQLAHYRQKIAFFQKKFTESEGILVSISKPQGKELNGGGNVAYTFQLSNGQSLSLFCSSTAIIQDTQWKLSFDRIPLLFQNRAGDQEFKVEQGLVLEIDGKEIPLAAIIDNELEKSFQSISWKGKSSDFSSGNLPGVISGKGGKLSISFL